MVIERQVTCIRCSHVWPTELDRPKQCPQCKSPQWDKPRKRDIKKEGQV